MGRMLRRAAMLMLAFCTPFAAPIAAHAEVPRPVLDISQALRMDEVMQILRQEGIASGAKLVDPTARQTLWNSSLDRIYNTTQMRAAFDAALADTLANSLAVQPDSLTPAIRFFTTDPAARAISLEIQARQALMDEGILSAAKETYARLAQEHPARQALLDRFVVANDLIDANVMGALNANLAFLRGMSAAGDPALTQDEATMLAQVQASEAEVRAETIAWLMPFLTLAYQPLSDADLTLYVAFAETPQGKALNVAVFQAFDTMFAGVSYDLGRAFALQMQGDDI